MRVFFNTKAITLSQPVVDVMHIIILQHILRKCCLCYCYIYFTEIDEGEEYNV